MPRKVNTCHALRALVTGCAVVTATVLLTAGPARAETPRPLVIPPAGPLYDGLSAQWWKYVLAQPAATNPLSDATGAGCRTGQSGPVFFLVGTLGAGTPVRDDCRVPAGKLLYFPLLNLGDFHTPGDGRETPELIWEEMQSFGFGASSLFASVDGVAVRNLDPASSPYYACSGPIAGCFPRAFTVNLPPDNLVGLPAGAYSPAVDEGYYLLLAPLRPGAHTLHFGGTGVGGNTQNVTYHLRVVF